MPYFILVTILCFVAGCATSSSVQQRGALRVHTLTMDYANVYLVEQGSHTVMIDSGLTKNAPALDRAMRELGIDPHKLDAIVITHAHQDHTGGARYFQKKYGTTIVAGSGDLEGYHRGTNGKLCPTGWMARRLHEDEKHATFPKYTPDVLVSSSMALSSVSGINGKIIPLPGHTKGSLVIEIGEMVFVGDLIRGSIVGSGPERHFFMCDLHDNDQDIQTLVTQLTPSAKAYYPGHFNVLSRQDLKDFVKAQKAH